MVTARLWKGILLVGVVALLGVALLQAGVVSSPWSEAQGDVRVLGDDGEQKAAVDVEVADTMEDRYIGLSNHDSLEEGDGMLFVHSDEDERTYVMREMDFDIDIIFIDADREITTIEHARAPEADEDGEDLQYTGQAQYVLEVPRGYANETAMAVGDEVEIDYE